MVDDKNIVGPLILGFDIEQYANAITIYLLEDGNRKITDKNFEEKKTNRVKSIIIFHFTLILVFFKFISY